MSRGLGNRRFVFGRGFLVRVGVFVFVFGFRVGFRIEVSRGCLGWVLV